MVVNAFVFLFFANVGFVDPTGLSRHVRVVQEDESVVPELDASLHGIERNLTRITAHVSMTDVEYLPLRMQQLVTGIPWSWVELLKRVATVVLCYQNVRGDALVLD